MAEAWARYPHAAGMLVVSPSPYGTCADIGAIAEICHQRDKPLIVDEAWGAHLPAEQVAGVFRTHLEESRGHVRNLEEAFRLLGAEIDDSPCPAIDGLQAEGKANAKNTDNSIVDSILLQGAVEVEHHEIGVYQNLILNAKAAVSRGS